MYYDPITKARREWQIFEYQKMEFMMIVSQSQRIVFEIDVHHYAEDEIALGTRYKHYALPEKYAEMMKAYREMSLAGYDVYRFGGRELWVNDNNSEADIIKYVGDYLKNIR